MNTRPAQRSRTASVALATLVTSSLLIEGGALAQSGSAAALFNEGYRLMEKGKLSQACDAFEASIRAAPGAGALLGLGECREQNQQLASAWSAYQDALIRAKDLIKRNYAQAKVAKLEPRLSHLTILVPEESRTAGLTLTRNGTLIDPILWNRALPTDGGDYIIEGSVPGREPWRTTVHVPIEGGKITVEVPKVEKLGKPSSLPRTGIVWSTKRTIAVGSAGASVIALATGAVLGTVAKRKQNDAHGLCPDLQQACENARRATDLTRSAHRLAIGADVAFGVSGVAVITAGVLWFTGDHAHQRDIAIVPTASPEQVGVTARWRF